MARLPLVDKIIYQHPYVGFIAAEHKGIFSMNICVGIYSGNQALSARFLIAGGAVDLTGKNSPRTGRVSKV